MARRGARPRPCSTGIDAIVIDLQDIGTRFYTYMTTMAYVMEEASKRKLPVFVLDRPNPINGFQIEGPTLDKAMLGFTGYLPAMPIRHGMTLGELARLFNGENRIGAALTVIPMKNWDRARWFDETGLPWINPSPNMRNLIQATLYPGVGAIESTNISVGRGTDTPFEQIGAPWIDGVRLADALNARAIAGVRFYPVRFTPISEQVRERGVSGRVHGRDRPRRAASGAARARAGGHAAQATTARSTSSSRRSGCSGRRKACRGFGRRRSRGDCRRHGPPPKRAGGCCARSISSIGDTRLGLGARGFGSEPRASAASPILSLVTT